MSNSPADEQNHKSTSRRSVKTSQSGLPGLIDLGIAVFLLSILALLCANMYVIYKASNYNDFACREALYSAANAFNKGANISGIMQAAKESLTTCGGGGFFIEHPQFTKFNYEKLPHTRLFVIQTSTNARPPAPWLVADQDVLRDGKLTITRTYVLRMIHLKKEQNN